MIYISKKFALNKNPIGNFSGSWIVPANAYLTFSDKKPVRLKYINIGQFPDARAGLGSATGTTLWWEIIFRIDCQRDVQKMNPSFSDDLNETFIAGNYNLTDQSQGDQVYLSCGGQEDKLDYTEHLDIECFGLSFELLGFKRNVNNTSDYIFYITFGYELI